MPATLPPIPSPSPIFMDHHGNNNNNNNTMNNNNNRNNNNNNNKTATTAAAARPFSSKQQQKQQEQDEKSPSRRRLLVDPPTPPPPPPPKWPAPLPGGPGGGDHQQHSSHRARSLSRVFTQVPSDHPTLEQGMTDLVEYYCHLACLQTQPAQVQVEYQHLQQALQSLLFIHNNNHNNNRSTNLVSQKAQQQQQQSPAPAPYQMRRYGRLWTRLEIALLSVSMGCLLCTNDDEEQDEEDHPNQDKHNNNNSNGTSLLLLFPAKSISSSVWLELQQQFQIVQQYCLRRDANVRISSTPSSTVTTNVARPSGVSDHHKTAHRHPKPQQQQQGANTSPTRPPLTQPTTNSNIRPRAPSVAQRRHPYGPVEAEQDPTNSPAPATTAPTPLPNPELDTKLQEHAMFQTDYQNVWHLFQVQHVAAQFRERLQTILDSRTMTRTTTMDATNNDSNTISTYSFPNTSRLLNMNQNNHGSSSFYSSFSSSRPDLTKGQQQQQQSHEQKLVQDLKKAIQEYKAGLVQAFSSSTSAGSRRRVPPLIGTNATATTSPTTTTTTTTTTVALPKSLTSFLVVPDLHYRNPSALAAAQRLHQDSLAVALGQSSTTYSFSHLQQKCRDLLLKWSESILSIPTLVRLGYGGVRAPIVAMDDEEHDNDDVSSYGMDEAEQQQQEQLQHMEEEEEETMEVVEHHDHIINNNNNLDQQVEGAAPRDSAAVVARRSTLTSTRNANAVEATTTMTKRTKVQPANESTTLQLFRSKNSSNSNINSNNNLRQVDKVRLLRKGSAEKTLERLRPYAARFAQSLRQQQQQEEQQQRQQPESVAETSPTPPSLPITPRRSSSRLPDPPPSNEKQQQHDAGQEQQQEERDLHQSLTHVSEEMTAASPPIKTATTATPPSVVKRRVEFFQQQREPDGDHFRSESQYHGYEEEEEDYEEQRHSTHQDSSNTAQDAQNTAPETADDRPQPDDEALEPLPRRVLPQKAPRHQSRHHEQWRQGGATTARGRTFETSASLAAAAAAAAAAVSDNEQGSTDRRTPTPTTTTRQELLDDSIGHEDDDDDDVHWNQKPATQEMDDSLGHHNNNNYDWNRKQPPSSRELMDVSLGHDDAVVVDVDWNRNQQEDARKIIMDDSLGHVDWNPKEIAAQENDSDDGNRKPAARSVTNSTTVVGTDNDNTGSHWLTNRVPAATRTYDVSQRCATSTSSRQEDPLLSVAQQLRQPQEIVAADVNNPNSHFVTTSDGPQTVPASSAQAERRGEKRPRQVSAAPKLVEEPAWTRPSLKHLTIANTDNDNTPNDDDDDDDGNDDDKKPAARRSDPAESAYHPTNYYHHDNRKQLPPHLLPTTKTAVAPNPPSRAQNFVVLIDSDDDNGDDDDDQDDQQMVREPVQVHEPPAPQTTKNDLVVAALAGDSLDTAAHRQVLRKPSPETSATSLMSPSRQAVPAQAAATDAPLSSTQQRHLEEELWRDGGNSANKRRRLEWSVDESEAVYQGYLRFGPKWRMIKDNCNNRLCRRTNVQIKDRFRTMVNRGEIPMSVVVKEETTTNHHSNSNTNSNTNSSNSSVQTNGGGGGGKNDDHGSKNRKG